jgi:hypothetical protein
MTQKRWLEKWLNRYGEPFVVENEEYRGVFNPASGELLRLFYNSEQIRLLTRPLWALYCPSSPALTAGTTLTWQDQTWVVLQRHGLIFDSENIYQAALISPPAV